MRWERVGIIILLASLLNAGNLLNTIAIGDNNIRPDLLLILMVFFAINSGTLEATIISFAIGFAADISSAAMGPAMISFGLFGTLISQFRKVVIMKRMTHQALAIFVMAIIAGGFTQILTHFKMGQNLSNVYSALFWTAVYSGLIGPLVWAMFSAISQWLGVRAYKTGRLPGR